MSLFKSRAVAVVAAASVIGVATTTGAVAAKMITGDDIKNSTITTKDIKNDSLKSSDIKNGSLSYKDLNDKAKTKIAAGSEDALDGAVYRVLSYKNGGGGSATVACADDDTESQKYTAIAGGVQGDTVAGQGEDGFAITASFPGRMDWESGEPKADRLDGWIVLGNGEHTETLKVWALCVPTTTIPIEASELDN